jgi:hypothetical protein
LGSFRRDVDGSYRPWRDQNLPFRIRQHCGREAPTVAEDPNPAHVLSMICNSDNGTEIAWWEPCSRAAGFKFGVLIENYDEFCALHNLCERKDEFGQDIFESLDRTYTVFVKDGGVTGMSAQSYFFVGLANIIGMSSSTAISTIVDFFRIPKSAAVYDEFWIEACEGVLQRFINFDDMCLFLTEDASETIITADVYFGG